MANEFQLKHAVSNLFASITAKGTVTAEDEKELRTHLLDTVQTLTDKGLTEQEAFEVAKMRLGSKDELAAEFEKINGRNMLHKEWVFVFVGIAFVVLADNLLRMAKVVISYNTALKRISTINAAILLSLVYLIMAVLVILLFKNGELFSKFFKEKVFDRTTGVTAFFATTIGLLLLIPWQNFLGMHIRDLSDQAITDIVYDNRFTEHIIRGTIPATVILGIFLSFQTTNKALGWQTIFSANNYLYIFLLGVAGEAIASSLSRGLFPGAWFGPIIFGLVIALITIAFVHHNRNSLLAKTLCFIAFPLVGELVASIYRGHGNWFKSPLFGYGVGIIISSIIGISIGFAGKKTTKPSE